MPCSAPPTATNGRHCGACTACCIHLPLEEGVLGPQAKPAGVPCPHVGPLGCRGHQRRPLWCAKFQCWWLSEPAWPAAWRPDRSGLLCVSEDPDRRLRRVRVYEIRPAALAEPLAGQLLAALKPCASIELVPLAGRHAGGQHADPPGACQPHRMAG